MRIFSRPGELVRSVGTRLGKSSYQPILQHDIDVFAALTGDRQWIHVDPARARSGPYGGPVVHSMYLLSLVVPALTELFTVDGASLVLNKGFDSVRFLSPVLVGSRVRVGAELKSAAQRGKGCTEVVIATTMEVEGQEWPVCAADLRLLYQEEVAETWLPLAS
jgi:acyl dehydratase